MISMEFSRVVGNLELLVGKIDISSKITYFISQDNKAINIWHRN